MSVLEFIKDKHVKRILIAFIEDCHFWNDEEWALTLTEDTLNMGKLILLL